MTGDNTIVTKVFDNYEPFKRLQEDLAILETKSDSRTT